jgi:hypothetical protein
MEQDPGGFAAFSYAARSVLILNTGLKKKIPAAQRRKMSAQAERRNLFFFKKFAFSSIETILKKSFTAAFDATADTVPKSRVLPGFQ